MPKPSKTKTRWVVVINGDYKFESELSEHLEGDTLTPIAFQFQGSTKEGFVSSFGYSKILSWARATVENYVCRRIQIFEMKPGRRGRSDRFFLKFSSCHPRTPAQREGTYTGWIHFLERHDLHLVRR
jgi:hypothetical protein